MSGIVGIVNLNGSPIASPLLQRMTELMAERGPDAQRIRLVDSAVGLGHALLSTGSQLDEQPCSLDGHIWITADARIDDRATLVEALRSGGISVSTSTLETQPDAVLILYAYQLWADRCVEYLLGDFAFAIWDGRQQRLFCSRDHFGVKPFYYACVGEWLLFSNTLDCLRNHPVVSDRLHDEAVADFLIFGFNQDATTTIFADIRRLPPGHCFTWTKATALSQPHLWRYWTLPIDGQVRYRRGMDYVERFQELLHQAVGDRLQTPCVGVFMSGGLDSTTVAAVAKDCLAQQYSRFDLCAHTVVYDRLIPDQERYYSGLAATALGIPIQYLVADDYTLYQGWNQPELRRPEPFMDPLGIIAAERLKQAAHHSRVVLSGEGGDPVLFPAIGYFSQQLKSLHLGHLLKAISQYVSFTGRLPPVGLRTQLRRWLGKPHFWQPPYPTWLNPDFAERLNLRERWQQSTQGSNALERASSHKTRPEAYQLLNQPGWAATFEGFDPGVTGLPVEVRHPFFDLRLVEYLLAIPPIPWFIHKELVRVAMRGILPEAVRRRPKTPLAGNPVYTLLQQSREQSIDPIDPPLELTQYIDWGQVQRVMGDEQDTSDLWTNLRPLGLVHWFHNLETMDSNLDKGEVLC